MIVGRAVETMLMSIATENTANIQATVTACRRSVVSGAGGLEASMSAFLADKSYSSIAERVPSEHAGRSGTTTSATRLTFRSHTGRGRDDRTIGVDGACSHTPVWPITPS